MAVTRNGDKLFVWAIMIAFISRGLEFGERFDLEQIGFARLDASYNIMVISHVLVKLFRYRLVPQVTPYTQREK